MIDYITERKERLAQYDGEITISTSDFVVFYEALDNMYSEYCGAREIEEIDYPVLEKYKTTMELIERKRTS